MFRFIKQMFTELFILVGSLAVKCVSLNNQPCQVRSTFVNVNLNKPIYYPFFVSVSKCSGGCNTIDDSFARICIPDKVYECKSI